MTQQQRDAAGAAPWVLVLGGGPDRERDVSLASAAAVATALRAGGYRVEQADCGPGDFSALDAFVGMGGGVVFPVLHGPWGEGGPLLRELEARGLSKVGVDAEAASLCMNKAAAKTVWAADASLHTPPWTVMDLSGRSVVITVPEEGTGGWVLKPLDQGSSLGVHRFHEMEALLDSFLASHEPAWSEGDLDPDELAELEAELEDDGGAGLAPGNTAAADEWCAEQDTAEPQHGAEEAGDEDDEEDEDGDPGDEDAEFDFDPDARADLNRILEASGSGRLMLESAVRGRELTVGVVDGRALPVIEIGFDGDIYDYQTKYHDDRTRYTVLDPTDEAAVAATQASLRAVELVGAGALCRIDLIWDGSIPWLIEANTMPGFTEHSLLPKAAAALDWTMPELCRRLVQAAGA